MINIIKRLTAYIKGDFTMKMKKLLTLVAASAIAGGILSGCGGNDSQVANAPENKEIRILTWDGYIPDDLIINFQNETGYQLKFNNFDTNEDMLAKLEASDDYDLVIGSDYILSTAIKKGLAQELDKSKIPNFSNLNEVYLNQYYDPESKYVVPYSAGTPLIVYDKEKVGIEINGYNDLWDPALAGKVLLMDDARNIIGMTLKSMGKSMNESDTAVLEQAQEKLMQLKDNIHHLDYNAPQESVMSGEVDVAYMFTPQVVLALQARPELTVVYPEEGMGFGIDGWFIPASAPNADGAHAFLNYMLDAENGAMISEFTMYQCTNKASEQYLSEEYKANKAIFIPSEILGNTEFIRDDIGEEAIAKYDEIWTAFKQSLNG